MERFRTVILVWIHRWLQNDAHNLKWQRREALFLSRSSVKFLGLKGRKINDLASISAFPDYNSNLKVGPTWKDKVLGFFWKFGKLKKNLLFGLIATNLVGSIQLNIAPTRSYSSQDVT